MSATWHVLAAAEAASPLNNAGPALEISEMSPPWIMGAALLIAARADAAARKSDSAVGRAERPGKPTGQQRAAAVEFPSPWAVAPDRSI